MQSPLLPCIVVTATASDGNTIDVTKDCTYSGFDSSSPKQCEITVHYGSFTCTFEVTIMHPERISNIESTSGIYFVGDTTEVKVTAITVEYSDGSERIESGYVVENKVLSESGTIPISVKYFPRRSERFCVQLTFASYWFAKLRGCNR